MNYCSGMWWRGAERPIVGSQQGLTFTFLLGLWLFAVLVILDLARRTCVKFEQSRQVSDRSYSPSRR